MEKSKGERKEVNVVAQLLFYFIASGTLALLSLLTSSPIVAIPTLLFSFVLAIFASVKLAYLFKPHKNPDVCALASNDKGIVFVWIVAAITIAVTALLWFVVSYPLYMIIDVMSASYTYPAQAQPIITLVQTVIAWFLAFEIFGVLIWALVSSFRREDQTYPA